MFEHKHPSSRRTAIRSKLCPEQPKFEGIEEPEEANTDAGCDWAKDRMAYVCRETYIAERSVFQSTLAATPVVWTPPASYDGQHKRVSIDVGVKRRTGSVWVAMAKKCKDLNVDAEPYIRFVFRRMARNIAPEPNAVVTEEWIKAFRTYGSSAGSELASRLVVETNAYETEVFLAKNYSRLSMPEAQLAALRKNTSAYSPLFKHLVAYRLAGIYPGTEEQKAFLAVCESFRALAFSQFLEFEQDYLAYWRKLIYFGFAAAANKTKR